MSTNRRIYLDFNATAPLVPAAREAMVEAMGDVGNASSVHAEGRRMRDRVERARNAVAALVGRAREEIVFTSGGTEANWLGVHALAAVAEQRGLPKVVGTTAIEHPSLRGAVAALVARGWQTKRLDQVMHTNEVGMCAFAAVNHELGTIEAMLEVSKTFAQYGVLIHVDAVQAAGKLPLERIAADSIAISGHKIGGPQGVGALAIAVDEGLPIIEAGHQERGRRPGTENTLGIIGFGAAAALLLADESPDQRREAEGREPAKTGDQLDTLPAISPPSAPLRLSGSEGSARSSGPDAPLRSSGSESSVRSAGSDAPPRLLGAWRPVAALGDKLEAALRAMGARIHGDDRPRVGGTINAAWPGALGESIVMALDLAGISVSTGAACTSGSIQPSAVLLGLGYSPEEAREAVRFSLGRTTQDAEIDAVIQALPHIVERARRHR